MREIADKSEAAEFQSSRPVAGARIGSRSGGVRTMIGFNPRAPLPGRASLTQSRPALSAKVSILAPRCRGAHLGASSPMGAHWLVSILAPRCRGAHPRLERMACVNICRVSILAPRCRGAHPPARVGCWNTVLVSILAPRCRGAHPKRFLCPLRRSEVSILAPRCRGAHRGLLSEVDMDTWFQSSRPVAGARIITRLSSTARTNLFQSSRPVAGARIIR